MLLGSLATRLSFFTYYSCYGMICKIRPSPIIFHFLFRSEFRTIFSLLLLATLLYLFSVIFQAHVICTCLLCIVLAYSWVRHTLKCSFRFLFKICSVRNLRILFTAWTSEWYVELYEIESQCSSNSSTSIFSSAVNFLYWLNISFPYLGYCIIFYSTSTNSVPLHECTVVVGDVLWCSKDLLLNAARNRMFWF